MDGAIHRPTEDNTTYKARLVMVVVLLTLPMVIRGGSRLVSDVSIARPMSIPPRPLVSTACTVRVDNLHGVNLSLVLALLIRLDVSVCVCVCAVSLPFIVLSPSLLYLLFSLFSLSLFAIELFCLAHFSSPFAEYSVWRLCFIELVTRLFHYSS